ncbi:immunity protein YezG family protein [Paenibacillus glacialis]|uniref:immunity protein YezG family protein n=1 Tax=Paenibacillus glacialis TaxID=494026 RepID=UPI003CCBED74
MTELFEVDKDHVDQLRYKLSDFFEELWKESVQNNQDVWTSLTFILDSTGDFKIDFDYEDLSEVDDFERQVIWRYKYLGLEPSVEKKRARGIFEKYLENQEQNDG